MAFVNRLATPIPLVTVKVTVTLLPAHTGFGVTVFVTIVWAADCKEKPARNKYPSSNRGIFRLKKDLSKEEMPSVENNKPGVFKYFVAQ